MAFTKITDYDTEIRRLIAEQFKNTDVEKLFTGAINNQFEEIETVLEDLSNLLSIADSTGSQLDLIGALINLPRGARDDTSYKTLLNIKAKALNSFGQPEILIEAVKVLYNATDVQYSNDFPAGVLLEHDGAGGLFFIEELITDDTTDLLLDDGEALLVSAPDTISEDIIDVVIPAGVLATIQNFP